MEGLEELFSEKEKTTLLKKGGLSNGNGFPVCPGRGWGGMAGGRREQYSRSRQHLNNSTGVE